MTFSLKILVLEKISQVPLQDPRIFKGQIRNVQQYKVLLTAFMPIPFSSPAPSPRCGRAPISILQDVKMSMQPQAASLNMNAVPAATAAIPLNMNSSVNSAAANPVANSGVTAASLAAGSQMVSESQVLDRKR